MYEYIAKKMGAVDVLEFADLIGVEVLSITCSDRHIFVVGEEILECKIAEIQSPVDTTGAGDAFFSVFVEELMLHEFKYDLEFFRSIVADSRLRVSNVLNKIGIF